MYKPHVFFIGVYSKKGEMKCREDNVREKIGEGKRMAKRRWTIEEINQYRKTRGGVFYYNKEDSNFLVPKAYGFGWTVNWANPLSWVFILAIIGVIILGNFI